MTPAAMTPAAQRARKKAGGAGSAGSAPGGHPRSLRQQPSPSAPRRVSGPVQRRAATVATPARPKPARTAPTRSAPTRPAPRRSKTTRPATARPRRHSGASRPRSQQPLPARLGAFIRSLPDHSLLDRLIRGRAWIPILGVMLVGIVAMQVEVLKLGSSLGRNDQLTTQLASRNQLLRASVASLSDVQRIENRAAAMGMLMPAPDSIGFLTASGPSAGTAAANIHTPDASTFVLNGAANGAIVSVNNNANTAPTSGPSTSPATSATSPTVPATTPSTAGVSVAGTAQQTSLTTGN